MKVRFSILLFLLLVLTTGLSPEKTETKDLADIGGQDKEQTEMLLYSKQFVFHGRMAMPLGGGSIDLTTNPNYIKFEPDLIESYMPFFGRAYAGIGYGQDQGLHFTGKPDKFTIEKKVKTYNVVVTVKTDMDSFSIYLTVSFDGSANLSINSNNRASISYLGDITAPDRKE